MGQMPEPAPPRRQPPDRKPPLSFQLPQRNRDNRRVLAYLTGRGIALPLLQGCIRAGTLYEDKRHNCVFVGFDGAGVPRYGFIRSSDPCSTFLRDADGSDKRYAFHMAAKAPSDTLHVFESAIDLLSYITLAMESGQPWQRASYLSLSGYMPQPGTTRLCLWPWSNTFPPTLRRARSSSAWTTTGAGTWRQRPYRERLPPDFYVEARFPAGKDYNAQLMEQKGLGGIRAREPKQPDTGHGR